MNINLQKFTLSTLTFSLVTTLFVGGFSESASARRGGGSSWGTSANLPSLTFNIFLEEEDGTPIEDKFAENKNVGVFENAIEIINDLDAEFPQPLTQIRKEDDLENGATLKGFIDTLGTETFTFDNGTPASLSAELNGSKITYQIFIGDDYKNPDKFLKFAPVDVSSRSKKDIMALVNDLKSILNDGKKGKYDVTGENNFKPEEVGVLGKAIGLSLRFQQEENNDPNVGDFIEIKKIDPTTKVPGVTPRLCVLPLGGQQGGVLQSQQLIFSDRFGDCSVIFPLNND